ncbi:hypothetical protein CH373_05780 [Leptospira perolatii]|uniref:Uncharacterized protein n=1 Tax=Leptospira perolatii TaxID=2023191 RepID=A0A2M9ZQY0_9LEPT|nr:hypothetical protein CH360_06200 [Leptospira perolatii]PJZ74486.1 hypothetical protein CH373_05780 [Leptospira perolatii]
MLTLLSFASGSFAWESKDKTDTITDWKKGEIRKTIDHRMPKVVFHPDDPDYNKEDTAKNLNEARSRAKERAREELHRYLVRGLENLFLNSNILLRDKVSEDEIFREIFQEIYDKDPVKIEYKFSHNHLSSLGKIEFKGKRGILTHIQLPYGSEKFPEFHPALEPSDAYTSLIVDARHLNVTAALFPEIKNEEGVSIYSPFFVKKSAVVIGGYVRYLSTPKEAMSWENAGDKPFFTTALTSTGKYPVDLVISSEDGERLLASPKTREALRSGKVIILLKQ